MSSPHDFSRRRKKGFRTLERVAEEGRGGAAPLFLSYDLARRAGKIVAPILRPFGMSLDFTEGHARVENGTLILLTQSAAQANRIRNLSTRLRVALSNDGLPIYAIECRVLPQHAKEEAPEESAGPARHPSRTGAAALMALAGDVKDEALRETLTRLAKTVAPRPEERVPEALRRMERLHTRFMRGVYAVRQAREHLPAAPDPDLVPDEASAAKDEGLAGVRTRMLARIAARREKEDACAALDAESSLLDARMSAFALPDDVDPEAFWTEERLTELDGLQADLLRWEEAAATLAEQLRTAAAPKAPLPPPIRMAAPPEELRREHSAEAQWEAHFQDLMDEVREQRIREDAERAAAEADPKDSAGQ